jgi:hypothetical protein
MNDSIKHRYGKLANGEREHFLERARESSKLTLPSFIREEHERGETFLSQPYQSVGARGVMNLSNKLLLSLFPPSTPFFRLLVSEQDLAEIPEDQRDVVRGEIDDSLREIEQAVYETLENSNFRAKINELMKHLIVAGVARDIEGNMLECIIRERMSKEVADQYDISPNDGVLPSNQPDLPSSEQSDEIHLYTSVKRVKDDVFEVSQELNGVLITKPIEFTEDELPYLVVRLTDATGESYGRGYVESVFGDLASLESLSQSVIQTAAIASKTVFFVNPGSLVRPKALAEAENGAVLPGLAQDVTTLQSQRGVDLNIVNNIIQGLEQRLGLAFLLFESAVRDSERTTAFEINKLVESLETVMVGTYAVLNQTLARPFIELTIKRMTEAGEIPELPESVKLIISTGVSNLGRLSELDRLQQFVSLAMNAVGPEIALQLINPEELVNRIATSVGVEKKGLVKTSRQLAEERAIAEEQARQQAMQEQAMQAAQFVQQQTAQDPELAQNIANAAEDLQQQMPPQ